MRKLGVLIIAVAVFHLFSGMAFSADPAIPDLTGKWQTKSYGHHHEKEGHFANAEPAGQWIIKEQKNRFFYGERTYVNATKRNIKTLFPGSFRGTAKGSTL